MKSSLPPFWEHFNFSHSEVEQHVPDREGAYKNLSPEALYTSDDDLLEIFQHPLIQGSFLDLGCGTGRTSLLYGVLFPERASLGIEREEERLKVGRKFLDEHPLSNVQLLSGDLLTGNIPHAENYFLYFPTGPVLDRILSELYEMHHAFRLIVIESHGDLLPRIDLENWLKLKVEIPLISQRHYPSARVYERTTELRNDSLEPFTLSYQKQYLLILEKGEIWVGESYGMEWLQDEKFNLMIPPRTIAWNNVQKVIPESEFSPELNIALKLRREGELEFKLPQSTLKGVIRKIIVSPVFQLEISNGEKVEWKDIQSVRKGNVLCYESSPRS